MDFARRFQKSLGKPEVGLPTEGISVSGPPIVFTGGGSSHVSEVTMVCPTATVGFPSSIPGVEGHHWTRVAVSGTTIAHKGLNAGAKAIADTGIDLLTRPDVLAKIKAEFAAQQQKYLYRSYLPADARPPVELYQEPMTKFRPLMEKFYNEKFNEPW
ncbi:MAG: hypothetical protein Q8P50_00630 [Bacillota bacterium]|nr:hypothetical protein [Bacillota bacterium]